MSLSHVKNKNTDKKMFLDFKPNHLISNVCAQVDQDDVTRKCERVRVYVRRMNILITAIEEREGHTPAPVLTPDTGGAGSRCPRMAGPDNFTPGCRQLETFSGQTKARTRRV